MLGFTGYYMTLWIILTTVLLLLVDSIFSRPLSLEKTAEWNEISYNPEVNDTFLNNDETDSDKQTYSYDWTIDGSGFPFYSDVDSPEVEESCPFPCTCVVETVVYCSRQGITAISAERFKLTKNEKLLSGYLPIRTESVHLGYNNLTFLPPRILKDVMRHEINHVSHLYLQNNQIYKINPDAFLDLVNLQTLDLSYNKMNRLTQPCEYKTSDDFLMNETVACTFNTSDTIFLQSVPDTLTSLNLNNNFIRGIPNYSFSSLRNLEVLRMSWNKISWISKKAFHGLHKLKVLQLRSNPLGPRTVTKMDDILKHFVTAEIDIHQKVVKNAMPDNNEFYLDENDINSASLKSNRRKRDVENMNYVKNGISSHQILRTIQLRSLKNLDLGETNLNTFPASLPSSIERLYLDNNHIREIPEESVSGLKQLEILHLAGNQINQIEDRVFSSVYRLQILDLSRNDIASLNSNSFYGMEHLWSLRLNGNRNLSLLPKKVFWSLPSLRLVYLHDCNLSTLPSGPWLFRIYALWLYGNPLTCSCGNLLSLLVRLHSPFSPKHSLRMDPYRSIIWDDADTWNYQRPVKSRCILPDNFKGHKVEDVRIRDMRCTYQEAYDVEISRRMASSKFVSADYQQDESTTQNNEHHVVTREEDEFDYGDKKAAVFDPPQISTKTFSSQNITNTEEIVRNESSFKILTEQSGSALQLKENVNRSTNGIALLNKEKTVTQDMPTNGVPDYVSLEENGNKIAEPVSFNNLADTNRSSEESRSVKIGTQWQISLPVAATNENMDLITAYDPVFDNGDSHSQYDEYSNLASESKKDSSDILSIGKKIASVGVRPAKYERTLHDSRMESEKEVDLKKYYDWDELESNWTEYPQGFAETAYDTGVIEFEGNQSSNYREEVELTLIESDILQLRENLKELDGWKSYNEYYSDVEFSGQDYEDKLFEYNFEDEVRKLTETGASFDDVIGNLSEIYNVSDIFSDYDYPPTTDTALLSIDDSVFDYDNL
uniref:uncharacterized protein LOC120344741 n=1 Tax=Styela clava TaxID=7725 RepID=UPI00193A3D07|nr:uncharacterized protein LOC120344741 [Styela clava]